MADVSVERKHCPVCGVDYEEGEVCPTDGATLIGTAPVDPLVGRVLKGTYRISKKVGQGGMGSVYRAIQMPIDRTVAVKAIFTQNPLISPEQVQRFLREARLLSQVNHPNVVSLIDFGNTETGVFFMVMEHLTGRTLDTIVPADQGLALTDTVEVMEQICAGVEAAHALQIVHRDLKPSNIFLHNIGPQLFLVKLLDFGIALPLDDSVEPLTQNGVMMGSCGYMAPEQIASSGAIDARADVYALGGILYFLLSGQPAYSAKTNRLVLAKQISQPPDPIDFEARGKPEAAVLMPVILKAMHQNPDERYQSAAEMLLAIETLVPNDLPGRRRGGGILLANTPAFDSTIGQSETPPALVLARTTPVRKRLGARRPKTQDMFLDDDEAPPEKPTSILQVVAVIALALATFVGGVWYFAPRNSVAPPASETEVVKKPAPSLVQGVTDTEIKFGMSAPFDGPSKELGRGMKLGIETYFRHINEKKGGIHGRKLTLVALNDGYTPERALANMVELDEKHKVFGFLGNVGTPTAQKALPFALDKHLLFFAPFTGAVEQLREDPPNHFVFHYRASYGEETAAIVKYLIEQKNIKPEQIAVFAQKDGYGDAAFQGAAKVLRKLGGRTPEQILRVGYERNSTDVSEAVAEIRKHKEIRAVVMAPTYKAAARFVQQLRDANAPLTFASVSFVGSDALAAEFQDLGKKYGEGVIVTQVVPNPKSESSLVLEYRELLRAYQPGEQPTFVSLEGYVDAMILANALELAGPDFDTEKLIKTLESIRDQDIGFGANLHFGPSEHQASHKVWGTVLDGALNYHMIDLE